MQEPVKKELDVEKLQVRDLMHLGVLTCRVDMPLCEVARIMVDNKVHCVVVVDEAGEACGIISDLGILRTYGKELLEKTAEDIMGDRLISISPKAPLSHAVSKMLEKHVHHLVILSEPPFHRPVGVLAASDIVREMAKICPK